MHFIIQGEQFVYGTMAIGADGDRLTHLATRECLFEPLVGVAGSRDQVVFGCATFGRPLTKATNGLFAHYVNHFGVLSKLDSGIGLVAEEGIQQGFVNLQPPVLT